MPAADRVRRSTKSDVNRRLDQERLERVRALANASPETLTHHIEELDRDWDVERVLEANASTLILVSLAFSRWHSRKWLILTVLVPAFLLQHAIQGWCPPIEVIRRLGVRTREEIDVERNALKALRGDFGGLDSSSAEPDALARAAIEAAERA